MQSRARDYVTLVEVLELTKSYEEFEAVIQAAVCRLEVEGIEALVSVQFYAQPDSTEAGAILTFADSSQIMPHIRMISQWDEFKQLLSVVKPREVRVYGKMSADAETWVRGFGVVCRTFKNHVAGFVRD